MDQEKAKKRLNRNFSIVRRIGGALLTTTYPKEPPILGPTYQDILKRIFDDLATRRKLILAELGKFSTEELQVSFSDDGRPQTETMKNWAAAHGNELRQKYRDISVFYLANFSQDEDFADFSYWSKSAFLNLHEALWLSVGLQPLSKFMDKLDPENTGWQTGDKIRSFMLARHELFRRELDPNGWLKTRLPREILEWINRVDLEVHPGFRRMLELIVSREDKVNAPKSAMQTSFDLSEDRFEAREKVSLAKLLVAMAIDGYGYDPDAERSPIPKEIQDMAAELGLDTSQDTIRKYLKLGSTHLPKGWKPKIG